MNLVGIGISMGLVCYSGKIVLSLILLVMGYIKEYVIRGVCFILGREIMEVDIDWMVIVFK